VCVFGAARREEGGDSAGGSEAGLRLLTTLLTEMDGVEEIEGEDER
jgi:SpoVK/Ycf46/Vps4 family AAA+-type ATPase